MKIGLHLPSSQPAASVEGILKVGDAAVDLGFDSLWFFDHLFTPSELADPYPYTRDGSYALTDSDPFFDPLALYGTLAGRYELVALGAGVLIPTYRHPIVLGKFLATVENFAPGRIMLGVGAGWMRQEFEAVGVDPARRGARLDEYIRALRLIWSGEPVGFNGEFYSWVEGGFLPAPTAAIPIIVGGHSDRALRRAATLGDGWAAVTGKGQGSGLDALAARIETLGDLLGEEGRSLDGYEIVMEHALWFSDQANPKMPFTGPPEDIAAGIKRAEEVGITHIDLMVWGPPPLIVETAQRFAEEVRPLL